MPAYVYGQGVKLGEADASRPAAFIDFLSTQDGIGFEPDLVQQRESMASGMLDSTGLTATQAEPVTARWIAGRVWSIPGPYTGLGPRGYRRSDGRILDDVCERLTRHGQVDASEIEVTVERGIVTLHGTVTDPADRRDAATTAKGVSGVIEVRNRLRIKA